MGHIIPLRADEHHEVQLLLPWYVSGRLEPGELGRVETHLAGCPECQADLAFERRLGAEVAGLPVEAQGDWMRLRRRMQASAARPSIGQAIRRWVASKPRQRRLGAAWLGWAVAAQLVLLVLIGIQVLPWLKPDRYQTLSAPPAAEQAAGIVVSFRPDVREQELREVLNSVGARLVDGPTAADAYVLRTPAGERDAALAKLRARPEVVLAEPLDRSGAR